MKTVVVNLIGAPGAGKSLVAALIFVELKKKGFLTEYCQEFAKDLVWQERFEELDNQYQVSTEQYRKLKSMLGKVQFIITDGPLLHGLYYNRYNPTNVCNIDKTEKKIWEYHRQFTNVNVFVERGDFAYEQAGRQQTEQQSHHVHKVLKQILETNGENYFNFHNGIDSLEELVKHLILAY